MQHSEFQRQLLCCVTLHGSDDGGYTRLRTRMMLFSSGQYAYTSSRHFNGFLKDDCAPDVKLSLTVSLSKAFAFSDKLQTLFLQLEFLDFPAGCLWIVIYPEHILRY